MKAKAFITKGRAMESKVVILKPIYPAIYLRVLELIAEDEQVLVLENK